MKRVYDQWDKIINNYKFITFILFFINILIIMQA